MAKLGIGIIGAGGGIANARAQYFSENPNCRVAACASRTVEKAKALAEEHGCLALADWKQVVEAPEAGAVCIATPNTLHFEQAKAALERGKHVLVEYPLCQTLEQADALKSIADAKKVALHHGLNVRSEPLYLNTLDALRRMGSIACARMTYFGGKGWYIRPDRVGDMFLALHIHFIDYFRGWFGEVKSLVATRHRAGEGEEFMHSGTILLELERCPAAYIEFGMGYPNRPKYTMQIVGSEGLLVKDDKLVLATESGTTELALGPNVSLKVDTNDFIAEMVDKAAPLRSWEDTRRSMQVALDCTRSAETGRKITY